MADAIPNPKNIHCPNPVCKSRNITAVGRYYPLSQLRVRYYRCNACLRRFKTEERNKGLLPVK